MNFQGIALCCPCCRSKLAERNSELFACTGCDLRFPVILGIPDLRLFPDPYIEAAADVQKGERIGHRLGDLSFEELVDYYYSTTDAVPPHHARQYKRGLMSAVGRAEGALNSWQQLIGEGARARGESVLDIGCGTAPLTVAAVGRFAEIVGVDISFRWLVVAKKRLMEAGVRAPLICACAEALPFPDGSFDRAVFDSSLETSQDQRKAVREGRRVLRKGGVLCISTPNRYSLGPDPHIGLWAGGYLPDRWLEAYARRQNAVPPRRNLLSARSLQSLLTDAGFEDIGIALPQVPSEQRRHFRASMRLLIDGYHVARRLPVSRDVLRWIGPTVHAVARKPSADPLLTNGLGASVLMRP
jgi:ubiquinone/menaquinone biosynthesis C-methylase UbiE